MTILLINPHGGYHHEYPPLGMLSLAAYLRKAGVSVEAFDEGAIPVPHDEVIEKVRSCSPRYIGISLYTTNISRAYRLIREIKLLPLETTIIVGGPHATAMPESTLQECGEIDFLVAGEGELTLHALIGDLEGGGNGQSVAGLYLRGVDGAIRCTGSRPYLDNLDELPFPAHDLVDLGAYQKNPISIGSQVASVITSRGCPFSCNFCNKAVFQSTIRRRSIASVVGELKYLVETSGIDEIYFQDDLFALDKKWLYGLMDAMRENDIRLPWRMLARVDILGEKDYVALRQAGCYLVQFGVESGNDATLKEIKKNITVRQVEEAFRNARRAGLQTYGFFIFGHPTDTRETILQTFRLAQRIRCDFTSFFLLVPFPGTAVYRYLPDHLKGDWDQIRYINWNKDLDPISLCAVPGSELKLYEAQVNMEYFGRLDYLLRNVLFRSNSWKFLKLKGFNFLYHAIIKVKFMLSGRKRVFNGGA